MARSTVAGVTLFLLLGASIVLAASAKEKEPMKVSIAGAAADSDLGAVEETLQAAEDGTDDVASLWTKARKLGKCIYGKKLVKCNGEYDYYYGAGRGKKHHLHNKRSAPKHNGKTLEDYAAADDGYASEHDQNPRAHSKQSKQKISKHGSTEDEELIKNLYDESDASSSHNTAKKQQSKSLDTHKHSSAEADADGDADIYYDYEGMGEEEGSQGAYQSNNKNKSSSKKHQDTDDSTDDGDITGEVQGHSKKGGRSKMPGYKVSGKYNTKPPSIGFPPKPSTRTLRKEGKEHKASKSKAHHGEEEEEEVTNDMADDGSGHGSSNKHGKPSSKNLVGTDKLWDYRWGSYVQAATISVEKQPDEIHITVGKPNSGHPMA